MFSAVLEAFALLSLFVPGRSLPTSTQSTLDTFLCNDGCEIDLDYTNDDDCDCSTCEDEYLTGCVCSATYGCPTQCNGTFIEGDCSDFECNDGCTINPSWIDDGWCDCSECEDEPDYDCVSCSKDRCSTETCGFRACDSTGIECDWSAGYCTCHDGCTFDSGWIDDDICDCSNCEDETNWDCDSCSSGCLSHTGDCYDPDYYYYYCNTTTPAPGSSTSGSDTYYSPWYCDDGCPIIYGFINDYHCDCTNCEDEDMFTCATCGGCPTQCGMDEWVYCLATTEEPIETTESSQTVPTTTEEQEEEIPTTTEETPTTTDATVPTTTEEAAAMTTTQAAEEETPTTTEAASEATVTTTETVADTPEETDPNGSGESGESTPTTTESIATGEEEELSTINAEFTLTGTFQFDESLTTEEKNDAAATIVTSALESLFNTDSGNSGNSGSGSITRRLQDSSTTDDTTYSSLTVTIESASSEEVTGTVSMEGTNLSEDNLVSTLSSDEFKTALEEYDSSDVNFIVTDVSADAVVTSDNIGGSDTDKKKNNGAIEDYKIFIAVLIVFGVIIIAIIIWFLFDNRRHKKNISERSQEGYGAKNDEIARSARVDSMESLASGRSIPAMVAGTSSTPGNTSNGMEAPPANYQSAAGGPPVAGVAAAAITPSPVPQAFALPAQPQINENYEATPGGAGDGGMGPVTGAQQPPNVGQPVHAVPVQGGAAAGGGMIEMNELPLQPSINSEKITAGALAVNAQMDKMGQLPDQPQVNDIIIPGQTTNEFGEEGTTTQGETTGGGDEENSEELFATVH